jgi:AcrR family transcriptional regulator
MAKISSVDAGIGAQSDVPQGKRQRTRAKLIDAAAELIGEQGLDRTSLEQIAARAHMTRGAVYGNFKDKNEIFLEVMKVHWKPIIPPFQPGADLRQHMRLLGLSVAQEARSRRKYAAAATAFQLYVLTHEDMRSSLQQKNAAAYQWMANELLKLLPAKDLPMPAATFIRVLDALITGLLFTYFQTPDLITEETFIAAFEALA